MNFFRTRLFTLDASLLPLQVSEKFDDHPAQALLRCYMSHMPAGIFQALLIGLLDEANSPGSLHLFL